MVFPHRICISLQQEMQEYAQKHLLLPQPYF